MKDIIITNNQIKNMVYLIYDKKSKLTKIGKTIDIKSRFNTIKCSNPFVILVWYSDKYTEEFLHKKYKDKRKHLEWFDLDLKDYTDIIGNDKGLPKTFYYKKKIKIVEDLKSTISDIEIKVDRWVFEPYFSGYYEDGNWFNKDGKKINKRSYNGCICIQDGQRRYGMKKLKTFAKKIETTKTKLPF